MTTRIEWRTKGKGNDALLLVGDYGEAPDTVMKAWPADARILGDYLNDMSELDSPMGGALETPVDKRDPQQWGRLILSRAQRGGDVLEIEPDIYWDGIYYWFRSRGLDPHPWRGR